MQSTFAGAGANNTINSFAGNTIIVNAAEKAGCAAFKLWDDAVYAPTTSQKTLTEAGIALVEMLKENNNSYILEEVEEGKAPHIYFQIYDVSINTLN